MLLVKIEVILVIKFVFMNVGIKGMKMFLIFCKKFLNGVLFFFFSLDFIFVFFEVKFLDEGVVEFFWSIILNCLVIFVIIFGFRIIWYVLLLIIFIIFFICFIFVLLILLWFIGVIWSFVI